MSVINLKLLSDIAFCHELHTLVNMAYKEWQLWTMLLYTIGAHSKNPELPNGLNFSSKLSAKKLNPTSTTPLTLVHSSALSLVYRRQSPQILQLLLIVLLKFSNKSAKNNNEGPPQMLYAKWQYQARLMSRINDPQQWFCHGAILRAIMSLIWGTFFFFNFCLDAFWGFPLIRSRFTRQDWQLRFPIYTLQ